MLKLLAVNMVMGLIAALIVVGSLFHFDLHGLGSLLLKSHDTVTPVLLLLGGFAITFGSVAMGIAVMSLPTDREGGTGGGTRVEPALVPIPVRARRPASPRH